MSIIGIVAAITTFSALFVFPDQDFAGPLMAISLSAFYLGFAFLILEHLHHDNHRQVPKQP